jgi:hypothetical protein
MLTVDVAAGATPAANVDRVANPRAFGSGVLLKAVETAVAI